MIHSLKTYHVAVAAVAFLMMVSSPASLQADPFTVGFVNITNNDATNAATAGQFFVDVTATGDAGEALFVFRNMGPAASSITDIYFDDGTLLGVASLVNSAGVSFSLGASPGELPGGNAVNFETTAGFSMDSDAPAQPNGVNPGEQLGVLIDLINGKTYADTVAAIQSGDLRIGIHVQGYANGGSEAFVNNGGGNGGRLPAPNSLLLFGSALAGLALWMRKTA